MLNMNWMPPSGLVVKPKDTFGVVDCSCGSGRVDAVDMHFGTAVEPESRFEATVREARDVTFEASDLDSPCRVRVLLA
jgi:hypothetical protein